MARRLQPTALIVGVLLLFSGGVLAALVDRWFAVAAGVGAVLLLAGRGARQSDVLEGATFYGSGHDGLGGRGARGRAPDSPPPSNIP